MFLIAAERIQFGYDSPERKTGAAGFHVQGPGVSAGTAARVRTVIGQQSIRSAEGQPAHPVMAGTDRPACSDNAPYRGADEHQHRPRRRKRVNGNRSRCRVSRSIPALEAYKAPIPRLDPAYARLPFLPRSEGGGSGADQLVQPRARLSRVPHATLQARLDRSRKVPAQAAGRPLQGRPRGSIPSELDRRRRLSAHDSTQPFRVWAPRPGAVVPAG